MKSTSWILDSGATSSSVNDLRLLDPGYRILKPNRRDRVIGINTNEACSMQPRAEGSATLRCKGHNGNLITLFLPRVAFIPEMEVNVISVRELAEENDASVCFFDTHAEIHLKSGRMIRTRMISFSLMYELTSLTRTTRRSRKQRR